MSARAFWGRVIVGLLLVIGLVAWSLSQWHLKSFTEEAGNRLKLLMELRKGAIEQYFSTARAELTFWSINPDILAAQDELNAIWSASRAETVARQVYQNYVEKNPEPDNLFWLNDAGDGSRYSELHARLHPLTKLFVSERGYYDMFLIGLNGDVYYTVEKESDFTTNLNTGPWRDSALGRVYRRAMESGRNAVVMSDMEAYAPSGNAPAIFMARAMLDKGGRAIGAIAFQLPTQKIIDIMGYLEGMGESGETYLVGEDKLMRSNSRFANEDTVLVQRVDTVAVEKALAGESGVDFITDYRGVEVLSSYDSLKVGESTWAVIAEFDRREIVTAASAERPSLAGTLIFIYGLSIWSVWYLRGSRNDGSRGELAVGDLDIELADFGDSSGVRG